MTVKLELKLEVEAALADQAKAKGVPLDAYLQNVVEDLVRAHAPAKPNGERFREAIDRLAEMARICRFFRRPPSLAKAPTRIMTEARVALPC